MLNKLNFYERYGVEEYYIYYPESGEWEGWYRSGDRLVPIEQMDGWTSPRLSIRFGKGYETDLGLQLPNGRRMLSFLQIAQLAEQAQREAEPERQRAEKLAQKLRELGINPEEL